ncbi:hypothetical protein [Maricaulis sp.]|uniref:hypothetical protein n=1 Tax=Maricaulis sp. TaxID=1486257 RepID=UPI000C59352B|nr:hypothetical protein [Maricaulis sp.]MAC89379.1 hypothetical protein [Maricaulis sp.]
MAEYASAGGSALPLFGGGAGQALNDVIPNQRVDRIVRYVRQLDRRLEELESQRVESLLDDPAKQDLVVMGGQQATRALSDHRIELIVQAVVNGISDDDVSTIRKNRLLRLLGQIDDDEVAILNAYGSAYGGGKGEWDKVQRPPPGYIGAPVKELDDNKLYEAGSERLLQMGLLEQKFTSLRKGELPEFDKTAGRFKGRMDISYLGRMLLREIGLPTEFDKQRE